MRYKIKETTLSRIFLILSLLGIVISLIQIILDSFWINIINANELAEIDNTREIVSGFMCTLIFLFLIWDQDNAKPSSLKQTKTTNTRK